MKQQLPVARVVGGSRSRRMLGAAPREVPRDVVWRLWLGLPGALFGWAFAAFGMVFTLVFLPNIDLGVRFFDDRAPTTSVRSQPTNMSENEEPIFEVRYTFLDAHGGLHAGVGYTRDGGTATAYEVAYDGHNPDRSELVGARQRPFGKWALCVLVFPIAGLGLALAQLRKGRRAVHLLRHGEPTTGKLVGRVHHEGDSDTAESWTLTFEYRTARGLRTMSLDTDHPAPLVDDEAEPMLHDPTRPELATPLDHLPGKPRITDDGALACDRRWYAFALWLPPLVTLGLIVATVVAMVR